MFVLVSRGVKAPWVMHWFRYSAEPYQLESSRKLCAVGRVPAIYSSYSQALVALVGLQSSGLVASFDNRVLRIPGS